MKLETMQAVTGLKTWTELWEKVRASGWHREVAIEIKAAASIDYKREDGPSTVVFKPVNHVITLDYLKARVLDEKDI